MRSPSLTAMDPVLDAEANVTREQDFLVLKNLDFETTYYAQYINIKKNDHDTTCLRTFNYKSHNGKEKKNIRTSRGHFHIIFAL